MQPLVTFETQFSLVLRYLLRVSNLYFFIVADVVFRSIPVSIRYTSKFYLTFNQIEGAFTLARLFSRLSSKAMLRIMLDGFQKIRDPRNLAVLSSELSAAALMTLSPGPARTNRDAELAVSLTREDGAASHVWAATLVQFDYDAVEAADSWWHNWGRFVVEGKGA